MGCLHCPEGGIYPSKRKFLDAIKEGDLTREGRCSSPYCQQLCRYETQTVSGPVKTGGLKTPKCLCWRMPKSSCPRHGQESVAPAKRDGWSSPSQGERVVLPYKKQTCDIVVQVGPLELVYPALVSEEKEPQDVALPAKEEEYVPKGLTLAEAPEWLACPLECKPYTNAPASAKPLSQREEFALIKRRLVNIGKERMRLARRTRLDNKFKANCARAAYQRKYEAVKALVITARRQIEINALFAEAKRRAEAPLTPVQQEFVAESCRLAGEERASMEAFLLCAKARRHRVCPHVAPSQEVCLPPIPTVRVCTVPWAGLDCSLTSLKDGGVVDGTLGAKSFPVHGDFTCNSSLGFPTQRMAVSVAATSLKRARRVVAATIKFAKACIALPFVGVSEVAHKIKTRVLPVRQEVAPVMVENIVSVPEEEPKKETIWSEVQLPEMGVRNIYAFHDDSWDASPLEDDKFEIPWSNRCPPCIHPVERWDWEGQVEPLFYRRVKRVTSNALSDLSYAIVEMCFASHREQAEELRKKTSWNGIQLPEMGVRNIYAFYDDSEEASPEKDEKPIRLCSRKRRARRNAMERNNTIKLEVAEKYTKEPEVTQVQPEVVVKETKVPVVQQLVQGETPEQLAERARLSHLEAEMAAQRRRSMMSDCFGFYPEVVTKEPVVLPVVAPKQEDKYVSHKEEDVFEECENFDEDDSDFEWVKQKYCVNRQYFCSSQPKREANASIFRNFPANSHAFLLELYRRRNKLRCNQQLLKRTCPKPIVNRTIFMAKDTEYIPHQRMVTDRVAAHELEWRCVQYNPDGIGTRLDIHNHFIYVAEFLEGCDYDAREAPAVAQIEQTALTANSRGNLPFVDPFIIPIQERGDFRAKGSVLRSLLRYTPFGDLTCNSAMGEIPEVQERMQDRDVDAIPSIEALTTKLASRKSKVSGAGENRVADKKQLTEKMVFHQPSVLSRMKSKGQKTITAANLNSDLETVRMQKKGQPCFTPLPRMSEEMMRKFLEKGIGSTSSVALDIGIQSHVPQGMPVVAFLNVMDTRMEDPLYSSLCGSYVDLGRDRAKTLCLPLANFPLSKNIEDVDDALNGLVLATFFEDSTGFSVGKPVFQYGTLEFQEFKESAYSDFSRVRDRWDEIAKRQNTPGDRVLAGFSVLGAVSQDYNQPLPEFGEVDLKCPPRNKPVVATYQEPNKMSSSRSTRSFRMPSVNMPNMTGRAPIPIQTNVRSCPRIVDGEEITPARFSTCNSGLMADTSIAHVAQGWAPKDATKGLVLEAINLREDIATSDNLAKYEWLAKGLIHPDLKLRMTVGQNPFVGISIGICCDYFGRLSNYYEGDTALPIEVCNQLPNFVCPISEKSVFEFDIDMSLAGYNLFQTSKGFADPVLLVYIIDTNSLPASDDWGYTCEICIKSSSHAVSVANSPIFTLPHSFDGRLPLDVWRGPFSFKLGRSASREEHIGINFGSARVSSGTNTFYSFPAAYTQLLQSVGGVLHGTIIQTGSRAISCELFLVLQPDRTTNNLEQALRLPGCRIPSGGGPFSIRIQTPFQREQIFNTSVQLVIYAIGGPMGVQTISAPYQYMVHFSHIQEEGDAPPRPIGNVLLFNWATISNLADATRFQIPARLSDLVLPGKTVTMRRNALANLIGSCGFFRGRVTFVFQWTLTVAHVVPTAAMQILTAVGRIGNPEENGAQILQSWIVPISQVFETEVEMDLTDYPGFNTSGGIGADHDQPFIDIACGNFPQISYMNINVRVHPGFELYGRSITPLRT